MQTIKHQRALGKLQRKPDMTLQRAPMPPIYDSGFARKVGGFLFPLGISLLSFIIIFVPFFLYLIHE